MRKAICVFAALFALLSAQTSSAHMFWINAFKSEAHIPRHVLTSIGYGHALPMDDLLLSDEDVIEIDKYFLVDPHGKRSDLHLAKGSYTAPTTLGVGLSAQPGDLGLNKISLTEDAPLGTYQVAATPKITCFTYYENKEGKKKLVLQYLDEIQDMDKIIASMRCSFSGKSFFTMDHWTKPEPLGFDLEILPENDLTNVRAGDLVTFRVLFNGEPLSSSWSGLEYMTAQSPSFGGPDNNSLYCKLFSGIGKLRIPAAGQWVVSVHTIRDVDKEPSLASFKGKTKMLFYSTTLTFSVRP